MFMVKKSPHHHRFFMINCINMYHLRCTLWLDDSSHTLKTIEQKRDLWGEFTTTSDHQNIDITFFMSSNLSSRAVICHCRTIPVHWIDNMKMWEKMKSVSTFPPASTKPLETSIWTREYKQSILFHNLCYCEL